MKDLLRNGILVLAAIASIVACSGKRARVIPSDKLSEIYAEMFLVDQWIKADSACKVAPAIDSSRRRRLSPVMPKNRKVLEID